MRYFLDDFVRSLSPDGSRRATFMLADAKIEKEQFAAIEQKLNNNIALGKLQLAPLRNSDVASGSSITECFREMDLLVGDIFGRSNSISLLLDNYVDVLAADIKALEDELAALEKSVQNYAFLISDNGAFDYAFLEPFSDERGRDVEMTRIPDRNGRVFDVSDYANIDTNSGVLDMSAYNYKQLPIANVTILKSNIATLLSNADFSTLKNIVQPRIDNGWKVAAKSPSLITGQMEGYEENSTGDINGAQFILEFTLAAPVPIDTITVVPFSDWGLMLSEIRTYKDGDDSTYEKVWDQPTNITGPINVNFRMSVVSRFRLYVRQPTYRRVMDRAYAAEAQNKMIFDELINKNTMPDDKGSASQIKPLTGSKSSRGWWDQRMLMYLEDRNKLNRKNSPFATSIPRADYRKNWGSFSFRKNGLDKSSYEENIKAWSNKDWATTLVHDVLKDISNSEIVWANVLNGQQMVKAAGAGSSASIRTSRDHTDPVMAPTVEGTQRVGEGSTSMPYVYKLGIRNVFIGISQMRDRAVFVSKRFEAPGDIGAVRIKSDYTNVRVTDVDKDTDRITSIEFSVSNVSKPVSEGDWYPILPVDTTEVIGERLYPDTDGLCKLRFTAKIDAPIKVYINGYHKKEYEINKIARRKDSPKGLSYDALTIPVHDYASADIITVDYTPSHDFTTLEFTPLDPSKAPPLVSSFDADGAGEGYDDSANQLVVTLKHSPYIDYVQVDSATYNSTTGLSGYSPIVVRFEDGTVAYNLTNYKDGTQSVLDSSSANYQFIHSGKTLMFNKIVSSPFRVFYQFQPSDVRVRVVLRCNSRDYATPRVDYYQIKAKTKKADAKRNL